MKPETLAKFISEVMAPLQRDIKDLQSVFDDVVDHVAKLDNNAAMTQQELKTYVMDRVHDVRFSLIREKDSFRGDQGPAGEIGAQGKRGDKGERGERGDVGPQGESGEDGISIKGEQGEQGERGERGERGEIGGIGKTGATGERGDTGAKGPQGERGETGGIGKTGATGERGDTGARGPQGERGYPGKDGKDGIHGERGYRGEKGDRGDPGQQGAVGQKGEKGDRGLLSPAAEWTGRKYVSGELVTHGGGMWQSRRITEDEPTLNCNSWELLSDGLASIEVTNHCVIFHQCSGESITTPSLQGDRGERGESVQLHPKYSETQLYRASLDEVKESGGIWRAVKSGVLHKPGTKAGKHQWTNVAHIGPKGDRGKDADEEAIAEKVFQQLARETNVTLDLTMKQVDEYFSRLTLNV